MRSLFYLTLLTPCIARAACPPYNTNVTFPSSSYPPDPFTFLSGEKVTTKADWQCRRAELGVLLQDNLLGPLPASPQTFNATLTNNKLTIDITNDGKKASFAVSISIPSNLPTNHHPLPAIISFGGSSVPLNETNITTITYNPDQLASTGTRGKGIFYTLHGSSHPAGAFTAWTWGLSRIIDALFLLGPETTGIDVNRIGLTGCSRHGKAVLVAGAFETRIALTIAQEGGVGGPSCWRLYEELRCKKACIPEQTDPWDETWFRASFPRRVGGGLATLPFDQHDLIALHAPRGLLVLENNIDWLQPVGATVCGKAGRAAYEALSVEGAYGFSLKGGYRHCALPDSQRGVLGDYIGRYLLDGGAEEGDGIFESDVELQAKQYEGWGWKTPIST
ncbi:hypothetical protein N0V90_006868 [Kalmusia sp. IMI 367209]|nr:hypothetical protein N0V90_006868 [Kalmusia sp. IMI 367209]